MLTIHWLIIYTIFMKTILNWLLIKKYNNGIEIRSKEETYIKWEAVKQEKLRLDS